MTTTDIRWHMIATNDRQFFRIEHVDRDGFLLCKSLDSIRNQAQASQRIDPLTSRVMLFPVELWGRKFLGRDEQALIRSIHDPEDTGDTTAIAGICSHRGTFLLVFESVIGIRTLYYIHGSRIFALSMKGGYILPPSQRFDPDQTVEKIRDFLQYPWISDLRFSLLKDRRASRAFTGILETIFSYIPCGALARLPLLLSDSADPYLCFCTLYGQDPARGNKIFYEVLPMMDVGHVLGNYQTNGTSLGLYVITAFFSEIYDKPCAWFEPDELEKACDILEQNGFGKMNPDVKKYNGIRSTWLVDEDTWLCIRDKENSSGYSFCRLKLAPVRSSSGKDLYYEIRMFPLCSNRRYQVLFRSIKRKDCERLISHPYSNLIRGNLSLLTYHGRELLRLDDRKDQCIIYYQKIRETQTKKAVYDKAVKQFLNADREDLYFLMCVIEAVNDII